MTLKIEKSMKLGTGSQEKIHEIDKAVIQHFKTNREQKTSIF